MLSKMWYEIICVTARIICMWNATGPFQSCMLATLAVLHLCYPDSLPSSLIHTAEAEIAPSSVLELLQYLSAQLHTVQKYFSFHYIHNFWLLLGRHFMHLNIFLKSWIQLPYMCLFYKHNLYQKVFFFCQRIKIRFCERYNLSHIHTTFVLQLTINKIEKVEGAQNRYLH